MSDSLLSQIYNLGETQSRYCTLISPFEKELDQNHDKQGQEDDEPREEHEGSREGLQAGVVDESVERVGEEVDEARDEGETGENPPHLVTLHGLAQQGPGQRVFRVVEGDEQDS